MNLIHGETLPQLSGSVTIWDNWIKDDANYCVTLAKEIDENDEYFWGCLSLNDGQILNRVFAEQGTHSGDIARMQRARRNRPLICGALVCEKSRYCYLLSQRIMTT